MKILITTDLYVPSVNGVVTSVVNLTKELMGLGHDVRVLTLSKCNKSYKEDNVIYIGSISANRIYPGARIALTYDNEYIEELKRWNPDVIHSQCEFSTFRMALNIARETNSPIVHTYHTIYEDYTHYILINKRIGKKLAALFTKRILNHADTVIAPTEKVYSLLTRYGVDKKIHVIPTGIDMERFNIYLDDMEKKKLRKKLGIPEKERVLIYVGRLAKEKNLEEILLFLSRLRANRMRITLLIVGDGPYRSSIENYANNLGIAENVVFAGMVPPDKIHLYYQIGEVFVSASNSETQGLTYIEALASGIPALCKKDSCLDNVIKDGVNGFQYISFRDFSQKLNLILNEDKYGYFCRNAQLKAVGEYSSKNFTKRVENVYKNTLKKV